MKYELNLSSDETRKIEEAFSKWSSSFRSEITSKGVGHLLSKYARLIDEVRSDLISEYYEYVNDISVRQALHIIQELLSEANKRVLEREIERLDADIKPHLRERLPNEQYGEDFEDEYPKKIFWWKHLIPKSLDGTEKS